jgi:superfamily II DNA or RNA helicase
MTDSLRQKLTLSPQHSACVGTLCEEDTYPAWVEGHPPGYVSLPRAFGLHMFGLPGRDLRCHGDPLTSSSAMELSSNVCLRDYQEQAVCQIVSTLRSDGATTLVAACGAGKTVMALAVASTLGVRTAVLVHRSDLASQWEERTRQFLPSARIGRIQGNHAQEGDVVVVMMASLVASGRTYPRGLLSSFGMVVVDECHHLCARTFSKSMARLPAMWRVGLTATPVRKDGLGYALEWYLGPPCFRVDRDAGGSDTPTVRFVRALQGHRREIRMGVGRIAYTRMVTQLVQDDDRNALLASEVYRLLEERPSRRGIVLSDRRKHLIALYALLGGDNGECCLYLGETGKKRKRDRDERASTKRCMLATVSLAEEGLDVPDLSFLVLATPKSEVEQCVGRILRPLPDKPRPAIVDIWDSYSAFAGMKRRREKYYIRAGFNIETH